MSSFFSNFYERNIYMPRVARLCCRAHVFSIFRKHIKCLSQVITLSHPALQIPKVRLTYYVYMLQHFFRQIFLRSVFNLRAFIAVKLFFQMYQKEAPWPSAQTELLMVNAYKVRNVTEHVLCSQPGSLFTWNLSKRF